MVACQAVSSLLSPLWPGAFLSICLSRFIYSCTVISLPEAITQLLEISSQVISFMVYVTSKMRVKRYWHILEFQPHQQFVEFIIALYDQNVSKNDAIQVCRLPLDLVRFQKQGWSWQPYGFIILGIWYNYAMRQYHSLALTLSQGTNVILDLPCSISTYLFLYPQLLFFPPLHLSLILT